MKYLDSKPFSSAPATDAYRDGWDRIFGARGARCVRCAHCGLDINEPAPSYVRDLAPEGAPPEQGHHAACLEHRRIITEKD